MVNHALVLGKSYPPHAGHHRLIRSVPSRRAIADGDPREAVVDVVFTSEDYGAELASWLGAKHVQLDPDRTVVPVSGTAARGVPWVKLGTHEERLGQAVAVCDELVTRHFRFGVPLTA